MKTERETTKRNGSVRLHGLLPDGRRTVATARMVPSRTKSFRSPGRLIARGTMDGYGQVCGPVADAERYKLA